MDQQTQQPREKSSHESPASLTGWRRRWHEVIFEADTPAGKTFDVALLILILVSVVAVMLESVPSINETWGPLLVNIEWGVTILFTLEYLARLACLARPLRFAFSFFGIVDLLALLPSYLSLLIPGANANALATIRTLRLLRVFRIFKMGDHLAESNALLAILKQTRTKITVFVSVILCAIVILGTIMYLIERDEPASGFTSIPISVYWAIVTLTTVGYGDIAPVTVLGQSVAALIMLLGYSIIVVTIGIFSAAVLSTSKKPPTTQACPHCLSEGHDRDARFCKYCGGGL